MSPRPVANTAVGAGALAGAWPCWPKTAVGKSSRTTKNRRFIFELSCTGKPCRQWLSRFTEFTLRNAQRLGKMGLFRAVLQVDDFRLAFAVDRHDKQVVKLALVNR